jgi:cellulose synthase/poly-beta-1,6-N-acetylglucosamine synthase-like glycosyltransferase/peptidoglycan/xylan/chitin deacetylase (PgdA/CDA1 family)
MTTRSPARDPRRSRHRRAHVALYALTALVLLAMLLLQGFTAHRVGASGTGGTAAAAAPFAGARPFLALRGGRLRPIGVAPGRRVALTFDDGPSSWTPRIAQLLHADHVPATFFVIGSQAARDPGAVLEEVRDGFTVGNHTFTHVDPSRVSAFEARLQVGMTESVVAGITGAAPRFFRPPYSSTPEAVTTQELPALMAIARRGYVITLADYNSEDWRRPGVQAIVRNAMPRGGRGGVVMFHDGGGDRSQTLAAVRELVPRLRHEGYRFVSLSTLSGVPPSRVEIPVGRFARLRGELLVAALAAARWTTRILTAVVIAVGALTALRMLCLLALALRQSRRPTPVDPSFTPAVSVVVPAFDEAVTIGRTVTSLAASDYPQVEVIVVDDGSTDGTSLAVEALGLPAVTVVGQPNSGKAAALRRGVATAAHDVIVMVDADTQFEPQTLRQLVQPLADPRVGAVSGNTKIGNRTRLLGRWQHIEYVMGFNLDRRMYELLDCMPTVPGAIGAFRRQALDAVGGISGETLAEDTDITIALGRAGWRVRYAPDARAWTEAPSTIRSLWRQRFRWAYGTLQSIWKHKRALVSRDPGPAGRRALPYLALFQIALPFFAPLVDLFAVFGLLFLDPVPIALYWLGFNALQLGLAVVAFRLDREPLGPLWTLPLQQFVYRQLMYLVVLEAVVAAVQGVPQPWQRAARTGEVTVGA